MDKRLLLSVALALALLFSTGLHLAPAVGEAPEQLMSEGVYLELEWEDISSYKYRTEIVVHEYIGTMRFEVVQVTADAVVVEWTDSRTWKVWTDGVLTDSGSEHTSRVMTVDIDTRELAEVPDFYTWLWIPTGISVGDLVLIGRTEEYEVVGSEEVEAGGLMFDAWVLRWEEHKSVPGSYEEACSSEFYYEKTTGVLLGHHQSFNSISFIASSEYTLEECGRVVDSNVPFDPDGDGLTSWEELALGTDHRNPDSDGDLWNDKLEADLASLLIFDPHSPLLPNCVLAAVAAVAVAATLLRKTRPPTPTRPINEKELRGLIERLDRRFIEGEIGEEIYRELKREYKQKLKRVQTKE